MAYAFSPFHLAHAAYHPHVAQTQWLPLYLLALWRCLEGASPAAVGFPGAAAVAVTLSNFYGGLIAAVITPVAVAAYWFVACRADPRSLRRLGITVASLGLIAAAGMAYAWYAASAVVLNRAAFAFPRDALFSHSAMWWSYLVPPVEHPLLGAAAQRVLNAAGVRAGLLEQQVSVGWGLIALAMVAVVCWQTSATAPAELAEGASAEERERRRPGRDWDPAALARVPILVIVAVVAFACSLSPEWSIGGFTVDRPSALLYTVAPMFRAYARFGVVVQLMAALLAGIGVDSLCRTRTRRACFAGLALVALAAGEYVVRPSSMWRDVLPTTAHRWVARQPDRVRALDCVPANPDSSSIPWLTGYRVALGGPTGGCTDPNLSRILSAEGYTHLIVRRDTADGHWFAGHPAPDGLRVAASFDDGLVFTVGAPIPAIHTATIRGFFGRERDSEWWWRWMGTEASWTIVNTSDRPLVATLGLELSAFHRPRLMEVRLDGRPVQTLVVGPQRLLHQIGPLTVPPGDHALAFHPVEAPTLVGDVINSRDPRRLSFALGTRHWTRPDQPR